jgi:hypothetical protein
MTVHYILLLICFRTVEQCSIEYSPEAGSCIEPHIGIRETIYKKKLH